MLGDFNRFIHARPPLLSCYSQPSTDRVSKGPLYSKAECTIFSKRRPCGKENLSLVVKAKASEAPSARSHNPYAIDCQGSSTYSSSRRLLF